MHQPARQSGSERKSGEQLGKRARGRPSASAQALTLPSVVVMGASGVSGTWTITCREPPRAPWEATRHPHSSANAWSARAALQHEQSIDRAQQQRRQHESNEARTEAPTAGQGAGYTSLHCTALVWLLTARTACRRRRAGACPRCAWRRGPHAAHTHTHGRAAQHDDGWMDGWMEGRARMLQLPLPSAGLCTVASPRPRGLPRPTSCRSPPRP